MAGSVKSSAPWTRSAPTQQLLFASRDGKGGLKGASKRVTVPGGEAWGGVGSERNLLAPEPTLRAGLSS